MLTYRYLALIGTTDMLILTPFIHGSDRLYLWRHARDISVTNTITTEQEKSTPARILWVLLNLVGVTYKWFPE